ncbi:MAG: TonB C-terminal domain-containing protein [Vicinamibacterales bacterium]
MYFEFDDHHPDTPRLETGFSRREGLVYSVAAHIAMVLVILFAPQIPWVHEYTERARLEAEARRRQLELQQQTERARFVFVQPRIDTRAFKPPPPRAELSDEDRTAQTVERPPTPTNPLPYSRGNSADRVDAPLGNEDTQAEEAIASQPGEQVADASNGGEAPPLPPASASTTYQRSPSAGPRAGGSLTEALQNLQRYVQRETFNNPQGGQGEFGPSIQFDTKGVEFGPWLRRFIAQIKRNWFIPYAAMSFRGHVVLTFNVHKDGSITALEVVGPASVDAFNAAAFNALAASNPTQPLPPEYPSDRAFFTVTFYYNESPPQ